jgi:hypothetical protein
VIAIGTARALFQVVVFFGGLGTYMYLGAGGMALVGTRTVTHRLVEFPPANVAPGFVVGGNAITSKTAAKGPKWLTNRHRNLLTTMSHTLAPSTYKEEQAERALFWGDDDGTTFESKYASVASLGWSLNSPVCKFQTASYLSSWLCLLNQQPQIRRRVPPLRAQAAVRAPL